MKLRTLSTRRHYEETPRVLTDLVHLMENDCALLDLDTITRIETPGRLKVEEFSYCSSASSLD